MLYTARTSPLYIYIFAANLEIDCPSLESPARGEVIFTNLTVGSTANYTCQFGYMISGVTTRVCQPGGVWSGEEPMCNSEFTIDWLID